MTATKLFKAGYTDLVSVIPPGAELSPMSKVKPESAGKAPGRKNAQGRWVGYGWQTESCTEADAAKMDADKANVGLKAGLFPGVDIDCTDETIAETIQRIAIETLGPAPVRVGQAPKRLLMFRTAEPFGRMRLWFTVGEKQHLVEVLGEGQQYVVQGIHPRTQKPYTWSYGEAARQYPPVKPEKLVQIDKAKVELFLAAVQEELDLLDVVCTREGSGLVSAQRNVAQESLRAPSLDEQEAAVGVIPNDTPSREEYIRMGYAIKAAAQEDEERGYGIFLEWCMRWEGGDNSLETVRADWERMHPPYEVGWDFVAQHASRYGYNYARTEFEAVAQPEEPAEEELIAAHLSDIWLTDRVISAYGQTIKWVPAWGAWLYWDDHCWRKDEINKVPSLVVHVCKETSDRLLRAAVTEKEQAAALKKAQQISSARTVQAVQTLLRSDARLVVRAEVLDADPWVMGTPGGVIDLKTGEILSMVSLPDFDPNLRPPLPTGGDPADSPLFNRAVQGVYELGSTFKIFTVANALELGLVEPDTMVDADAPKRWGGNVFLQVMDPQAFAGREAFAEQMDHLADRCRENRPIDPSRPVRLPGDQAARGITRLDGGAGAVVVTDVPAGSTAVGVPATILPKKKSR